MMSLIVDGGAGRAARNWKEYQTIVKTLKELEADETMLVQSGKAVGVLKTWPHAPACSLPTATWCPPGAARNTSTSSTA